MTASPRRQIDWSTATVDAGKLTAQLTGARPRGWRRAFESVARLLDSGEGRWGAVAVRGDTITVVGVQSGSEQELRHLLEGIVLQVNADLRLTAPAEADADTAADRSMAAAFRSFAER